MQAPGRKPGAFLLSTLTGGLPPTGVTRVPVAAVAHPVAIPILRPREYAVDAPIAAHSRPVVTARLPVPVIRNPIPVPIPTAAVAAHPTALRLGGARAHRQQAGAQ